jgi:hypothetical protein
MEKKFIKISDLNLSSSLLCCGFDVIGIDSSDPSRVYFYFEENPKILETIKSHWDGTLRVSSKLIASYRRELLNRIYQGGNR